MGRCRSLRPSSPWARTTASATASTKNAVKSVAVPGGVRAFSGAPGREQFETANCTLRASASSVSKNEGCTSGEVRNASWTCASPHPQSRRNASIADAIVSRDKKMARRAVDAGSASARALTPARKVSSSGKGARAAGALVAAKKARLPLAACRSARR